MPVLRCTVIQVHGLGIAVLVTLRLVQFVEDWVGRV